MDKQMNMNVMQSDWTLTDMVFEVSIMICFDIKAFSTHQALVEFGRHFAIIVHQSVMSKQGVLITEVPIAQFADVGEMILDVLFPQMISVEFFRDASKLTQFADAFQCLLLCIPNAHVILVNPALES
jgi:hypothetical protein